MRRVIKYVPTTQHFYSKRMEYLLGKRSVVTTLSLRKHESSGMMDVHDVVSDYNATAACET
jgi:hypothetical protein